ncbi:Arginine--tRNA ligase [Sterolibacterium denitrificans]|uniref:Arginine--tRNA ligase n=1 Tax=Sterolibacterium denitrificans TaxID=157592 RepID=A0A7Z7HQV0_9PROT|nr:arginine--tRNA ligase [Sterolibacterium denitrificans]SMB21821.1 Arginine--tRNA ligase [Sterolibacterium denitrificans]
MTVDPKSHLAELLGVALASVAPELRETAILLERPKQASHGDFASNLALQLAKALKANPREIAQRLVRELPVSPWVDKVEVAGAGFINFHLSTALRSRVVAEVLARGADFGRCRIGGGRKLQIEFVSANPTGPLHVGHGRGAALGASLANLLSFAGWAVTREYYVNDAGRQMDILAVSTWLRYLALFDAGWNETFPPNAYQGDYVAAMAAQIRAAHGERFVQPVAAVLAEVPVPKDEVGDVSNLEERLDALIAAGKRLLGEGWDYIHQYALTEQLADGRADLEEFGVHFDVWFSERSLYDTGMVARAVERLEANGHIYVQDGAKWFRSTQFGDEKDRVVQRDNGLYTYFASDIAYHCNKLERGFEKIIDLWGADHHGYIPRVRGALQAMGCDGREGGPLDVLLVQFVALWRGKEKLAMSTRAGQYVTLRDLRQEVGNDACRFFYMLRKAEQALDFDLELAKSQSNDNPVYYVQYAHARVCSVLNQWGGDAAELAGLAGTDLAPLAGERELALCARLATFPEIVEDAAVNYAPQVIAFYLKDLAGDFHSYYNAERILVEDAALRAARLALAAAVRQVLRNGLGILGVSTPESM